MKNLKKILLMLIVGLGLTTIMPVETFSTKVSATDVIPEYTNIGVGHVHEQSTKFYKEKAILNIGENGDQFSTYYYNGEQINKLENYSGIADVCANEEEIILRNKNEKSYTVFNLSIGQGIRTIEDPQENIENIIKDNYGEEINISRRGLVAYTSKGDLWYSYVDYYKDKNLMILINQNGEIIEILNETKESTNSYLGIRDSIVVENELILMSSQGNREYLYIINLDTKDIVYYEIDDDFYDVRLGSKYLYLFSGDAIQDKENRIIKCSYDNTGVKKIYDNIEMGSIRAEHYGVDINGELWRSWKGYVQKLEGSEFINKYKVKEGLLIVDAYDDNNLIVTNCGMYYTIINNNINKEELINFISSIYEVMFNRNPDYDGLNYWYNQINNKKINGRYLLLNLLYEPEFINKDMSVDEFVKYAYKIICKREPDTEGFNYWINRYNEVLKYRIDNCTLHENCGVSKNPSKHIGDARLEILNYMMNESEFKERCESMGIKF